MKAISLILIFFSFSLVSIAQKTSKKPMKKVTTIGVIDTDREKSGYRINEYYVELSDAQLKKYAGKKIQVSGKLLVVPGIDPNDPIIRQGSTSERYFIVEPVIKILSK
jgi:hypothetical protein